MIFDIWIKLNKIIKLIVNNFKQILLVIPFSDIYYWIIKQPIITMRRSLQTLPQHYRLTSIIIVFCCLIAMGQMQTITGTLAPNQRGATHTHSLTGYGANDLIRIQFQATGANPLTTTSVMVNFIGPELPNSISLQQFYHQNPEDIRHYDLDAMWQGREQFINIYRPSLAATTLHLTVFNFDPSYRQTTISYSITIDGPGQTVFSCDSCTNSQSYENPTTSCFCTGCSFQKQGKICSRYVHKLEQNSTFVMQPQIYQYFVLKDTDKVTVTVSVQGGLAQAYFQFQQFEEQVANYFNVAKGSSDGRYLINNNALKVGADTQQRPLLITLVSFQDHPINASISYSVESTVSVLVIVMAVLGSVILVVIIITVVCIIKRRNAGNRINSQLNLPSQTAKLTGEEIQRYFPMCTLSEIQTQSKIQGEMSINQFSAQKQAAGTEQDCVICLEMIKSQDQIRIGYCKHMFHGPCLISWFKKQRNCPYCRKEYNRDETVGEYNKLVSENENRVLKDVDLARAIYNKKSVSKTYIENLQ